MSDSDRTDGTSRSEDGRGRHARPSERRSRRIREAPGEAAGASHTRLPRSSRRAEGSASDRAASSGSAGSSASWASSASSASWASSASSASHGRRGAASPRGSRRSRSAGPHDHRQLGPTPVKVVLGTLSALLLFVGWYGHVTFGDLLSSSGHSGQNELGNEKDGATDILLVGVDSRTDAQGNPLPQDKIDMLRAGEEEATNTDTIILIRVPNDGSSATAVSLPRDTYVHTEYGNQKINGVYANAQVEKTNELTSSGADLSEKEISQQASAAGREALISTVADVTGITVDHFAEVGLLGFVELTDAVGGVDVCLNNAVDEPLSGANFPAGQQTLDGPNALSFVRQRHDLPRGDLDRITRQQVYLASLTGKVLSAGTLINPSKLSQLSNAVKSSVILDDGWDIMGLAIQMQALSGGNVSFETIPVTSIDGTGDYGESVVTIDKQQVHSFFNELLGDNKDKIDESDAEDSGGSWEDIGEYNPADSVVDVYNSSEVEGLAARIGDLVSGAGYTVGEVDNAVGTGVSESQVNVADVNDPAARGLAKQLGNLKVVEDSSLPAGRINVTLAGTYDGPGTSSSGMDEALEPIGGSSGNNEWNDTNGSEENVGTPGTDATGEDVLNESSEQVGTPGTAEDSTTSRNDDIHAGGDGPMCVN